MLKDGALSKEIYNVMTAQIKSSLFNKIANTVEIEFRYKVPINASPFFASNNIFDHLLKLKTLKT